MFYSLSFQIINILFFKGAPDTKMNWLDAITGCHGICFIDDQSVTFSNFEWTPVEK